MAFQAVKPHCTAFLRHVRLADPANVELLPDILANLSASLAGLGDVSDADNLPKLTGYLFFPFSQFLQLNSPAILKSTPSHQHIFQLVVDAVNTLASVCPLDKGIREQLCTFCMLSLAGQLGSKDVDRSWSTGVQASLLHLFGSLVSSDTNLDLPLPIVLHSVNALLLLVETGDFSIQLASLDCLSTFLTPYLLSHDLIPRFLPGVVSTICKVVISSKGSSRVCVKALNCMCSAIVGALDDERSRRLGILALDALPPPSIEPQSLHSIFEAKSLNNYSTTESSIAAFDITTATSSTHEETKGQPGLSAAWLSATSGQLYRAFVSILPFIQSHESANVRSAVAHLCDEILAKCWKSLGNASCRLLLEELLSLGDDDWEEVRNVALRGITQLADNAQAIEETARIAQDAVAELPHVIFRHGIANEGTLQRHLTLICAACKYAPLSDVRIERWSRSLIKALEMVAPVTHNHSNSATLHIDASTPWMQQSRTMLYLEGDTQPNGTRKATLPAFPVPRFVHIAPGQSVLLLERALQSLAIGAVNNAASGHTLEIISHFLNLARSHRPSVSLLPPSLWITAQMLIGLRSTSPSKAALTKQRLVRDMVDVVLEVLRWQDETASGFEEKQKLMQSRSNGQLLDSDIGDDGDENTGIEVVSGMRQLQGLLGDDSKIATLRQSSAGHERTHTVASQAMAIQLLSTTAKVAGRSFRPYLLHVLYPLLRALVPISTSTNGMISAYAHCALHTITHACEYDSPATLITANIDYLLNAVSANLRASTGYLDHLAPSILICAIDLAGQDVLPYLGDTVAEIFDALDRWHAYDLLVSELLRVLDKLVSTFETPTQSSQSTAPHPTPHLPNRENDLAGFAKWFETRTALREQRNTVHSSDSIMPDGNPQQPFANLHNAGSSQEEASAQEEPNPDPDGETKPASATQNLILSIMQKCIYFMGHPSPFLRARVLAMLSACVPAMCDLEADLLPVIHRVWPYVLARLDDGIVATPPYVLLECMRFVSTLLRYKGSFMNTRMVQDVWPRVKSMVPTLSVDRFTKEDRFSTEYRIAQSMIDGMFTAVSNVTHIKGEDLWDMSLVLRPFLSSSEDELNRAGVKFYRSLAKSDSDIVWLALSASIGKVPDLQCLFSSQSESISVSIMTVLSEISSK
ncbi:hypothetical protein EMMF5_005019 [Cystobasidiomycetes sp. EMM_F5]